MIEKYASKIFFGIIILFALKLCFLFFLKNPYTMLEKQYGLSSGYVKDNLIRVEEINDKQTMYFIRVGNNGIRQSLVIEYPFGYSSQSDFWFDNTAGAKQWELNDGKSYHYSVFRYRTWSQSPNAKKYSWTINGVLYDDNIKNVVIDGAECTIVDLQLEDEKLRYFYYIYPEKLSTREIPLSGFDDMNIDFIY